MDEWIERRMMDEWMLMVTDGVCVAFQHAVIIGAKKNLWAKFLKMNNNFF